MKFRDGKIKSQALAGRVTVEISMSRREFVELNSDEDVVRLMGLSEPIGAYGSDFITADVDFDFVLDRPEVDPPGTASDRVLTQPTNEPEDEKTDPA